GGRMTPTGTSRIRTDSGFATAKFEPEAVATIDTHDPGTLVPKKSAQLSRKMPFTGAGGAVNRTDAVPSLPVMMVRADKVPKSTGVLPTAMSIRTGTPAAARPSGPIAVTVTVDRDPPSWLIVSGLALTRSVSASADGPESEGADVS